MTDKIKFSKLALRDIRAIFGQRGVDLAKRHGYYLDEVTVFCRDRDGGRMVTVCLPVYRDGMTVFDDHETPWLVLSEDGASSPFTRIHEFAHLYHCAYHPEVSQHCPSWRTEVVGRLAERILQREVILPPTLIAEREAEWAALFQIPRFAEIERVACRVEKLDRNTFHDLIPKVLWGWFG